MKKVSVFLVTLLMLFSFFIPMAFAEEEKPDISVFELPKPTSPYYMVYGAADRSATEGSDYLNLIAVFDMSVLELGAEYEADSDAFYKKYGLYSFDLYMQFDTSLDGVDNWNYTPEWDTYYGAPDPDEATATQAVRSELFEKVTIFDLYSYPDSYGKISNAVIRRDVPDREYTFNNFYFDYENHSLSVRCRYYMSWEPYDGETIGDKQSKVGEWSDVAVFGKNGNNIMPEEPENLEAPVISDLKYIQPGESQELGYFTYIQSTPEQVWNAGIYYEMTGTGEFEGLETEISVDDGDWQPYTTVNSWGDWCLWNGERVVSFEEPKIAADSNAKLRVRFLGTHGPSEWSNVIDLNGGGTQEISEETAKDADNIPTTENEEKCGICGFCPKPAGICIFILIAIALAVILIVIIATKAVASKKKNK